MLQGPDEACEEDIHSYMKKCPGFLLVLFLLVCSCTQAGPQAVELKRFPADGMEGVITASGIEVDRKTSSDGAGSLKIAVSGPTVVRLFEVSDIEVEDARLLYQAKVRSEALEGTAYLEMWCHFPGRGEFFSRSLNNAVTATTEWTTQETLFFLKEGEKPDLIRLNLVVDGKGTVWVDDIRLVKGPFN